MGKKKKLFHRWSVGDEVLVDYYGVDTWFEATITHLLPTGYRVRYPEKEGIQEVDSPKMRPRLKYHTHGTEIKERNYDEGDISDLTLSDEEYKGEPPFLPVLTSFTSDHEEKKYKEAIKRQDERIETEKKEYAVRRKKK